MPSSAHNAFTDTPGCSAARIIASFFSTDNALPAMTTTSPQPTRVSGMSRQTNVGDLMAEDRVHSTLSGTQLAGGRSRVIRLTPRLRTHADGERAQSVLVT